MLPSNLTIEALYTEHPSHPRYRHLADVLYRARIIEKWGTGTLRIAQACLERGLPRPEFRSEMGTFIVRFTKSSVDSQLIYPVRLNSRQTAAISYVHTRGKITSGQYTKVFNISDSQTLKDLNDLIEQGIFTRRGKGPSTHYVIFSSADVTQQANLFAPGDDIEAPI